MTYRGDEGPLGVSAGNDMRLSPLYRAFIDAGVQAGYPETEDYNGEFQEGFGPMHMTVSGGVRESTARAYLKACSEPTQSDAGHSGTRASDCARWQAGNGRGGERNNQTTTYTATNEVISVGREYCLSGSSAALRYRESGPPRRHRY